jgi:hypothetical protein
VSRSSAIAEDAVEEVTFWYCRQCSQRFDSTTDAEAHIAEHDA